MKTKAFFLSLALLFCTAFLTAGSTEIPAAENQIEVLADISNFDLDGLTFDEARCTVSGTFTTSGGSTYEVTVTADSCADAAGILVEVGEFIDNL